MTECFAIQTLYGLRRLHGGLRPGRKAHTGMSCA